MLHSFCRLICAIALVASPVGQAQARQSSLSAACAQSPFDLDCSCLVDRFEDLTSGYNREQVAVADKLMRIMMGLQVADEIANEKAIAMTILPEIMPVQSTLTEVCRSTVGSSDPASPVERERIVGICQDSLHYMDCTCIASAYEKAAAGLSADGQAFALAVIAARLNVSVSPSYDEVSDAIKIQFGSVMDDLDGFGEACAIATPSAIAAYNGAGRMPAPTMEARANAPGPDSMRMWCEAVDGHSPALCACRIQVIGDVLPEEAFRFSGESAKALALVELGRLDGPARYRRAASALGHDDEESAERIYRETTALAPQAHQIAREVCDAVESDLSR